MIQKSLCEDDLTACCMFVKLASRNRADHFSTGPY
jgi:hypothetical protein